MESPEQIDPEDVDRVRDADMTAEPAEQDHEPEVAEDWAEREIPLLRRYLSQP